MENRTCLNIIYGRSLEVTSAVPLMFECLGADQVSETDRETGEGE